MQDMLILTNMEKLFEEVLRESRVHLTEELVAFKDLPVVNKKISGRYRVASNLSYDKSHRCVCIVLQREDEDRADSYAVVESKDFDRIYMTKWDYDEKDRGEYI